MRENGNFFRKVWKFQGAKFKDSLDQIRHMAEMMHIFRRHVWLEENYKFNPSHSSL